MNQAPDRRASTARTFALRSAASVLVAASWLLGGPARGEGPPPRPSVLELLDHGTAPGVLVDSARPGVVRWQSRSFLDPFEFPQDEVASIRFPAAEGTTRAVGELGFELSGGDVFYGRLLGLDDRAVDVEAPRFGHVRVDRSRLRRVFRWRDGADLLHEGPNGLVGWRDVVPVKPRSEPIGRPMPPVRGFQINEAPMTRPDPPRAAQGWVEDGRSLRAARDGATIQADLGLPGRASIDVELSWKRSADFVMALGVTDDEKSVARAFHLEVWAGQVVAVRETDDLADLAAIQPIAEGPGRLHLQLYLDQALGRLAVYSEAGDRLADLKIGGTPGPPATGVRLTNVRGDLRLERLRVGRWDGDSPPTAGPGESTLGLSDRSSVRGQVERFDPATREYVVRGESGETRVAEDRVDSIAFARPREEPSRAVRVAYQDGTQIAGTWAGVEGGKVILMAAGFAGLLQLPQEGMRSMDVLGGQPKVRDMHALEGTLEMDDLRIMGHLVDSGDRPGEWGLAWRPLAGGPAATIRPGASGRIVYRAARPTVQVSTTATRSRVATRVATGVNSVAPQFEKVLPPLRRSLYLRTGDIIPVEVDRIDGEGVWFKTKFSDNSFVPHARVKAVELAPEDGTAVRLDKAKFDRLLTLPRMQKDHPPRHLIRSTNGDILRADVVGMDDKTIGIEVRLEEKVLPRDRVARIIWLHPDETDPTKKAAEPPAPDKMTRVQAVRSDGVRLTFNASKFLGGVLMGKSEVLGDCKVAIDDLDQLLIGGMVEEQATQLAYQDFKLQGAAEPKSALFERGESPGGGAAGTESAMVGKDAPDFQLDLLAGGKFRLAEARGKVVVLDFWASWCGPCVQAMPLVDKVAREFADKGVQLVAVNLQEGPPKIKGMLDRLKLSTTVVLDLDGVVAAKYGASAIPQTVVVDAQGKVARLFIGGGPQLEGQLREAIQSLMPPAKP